MVWSPWNRLREVTSFITESDWAPKTKMARGGSRMSKILAEEGIISPKKEPDGSALSVRAHDDRNLLVLEFINLCLPDLNGKVNRLFFLPLLQYNLQW